MSWAQGMADAYARGVADGRAAATTTAPPGGECTWQSETFTACYCEGFGHGAKRCACPEHLAGARQGQRCVVCGNRRHPEAS